MRILVYMSDNRQLVTDFNKAEYNSLAAYINKVYCNLHGYDFVYVRPYYKDPCEKTLYVCKDANGALRHASWAKLLVAQHLMEKYQEYDYVVYIDSDCIFKKFDVTLESIITDPMHKDVNIIYAASLPWHKLPCAGFFIVKVNEYTRKFMESWYNYQLPSYNSIEWKNTLVMAKKYDPYDWIPNKHWEQDALWCMIANNVMIPYTCMNENTFQENNDQFLRHICHVYSNIRQPYFKQFVNKLTDVHGSYESITQTIQAVDLDTE